MASPHTQAYEKAFLLLSQCHTLCKKFAEKELSTVGVTIAEYSLLRSIESHPNTTAGEAAKRVFSSPPSIAQLVKRLKGKRLIESTLDVADIRRQPLMLTAKGKNDVILGRQAIQIALQKLNIGHTALKFLEDSLSSLFSSLSSYGN